MYAISSFFGAKSACEKDISDSQAVNLSLALGLSFAFLSPGVDSPERMCTIARISAGAGPQLP